MANSESELVHQVRCGGRYLVWPKSYRSSAVKWQDGNLLGSLSCHQQQAPGLLLCCRLPVLEALSHLQQGITRGGEGRVLEMLCFVF